MTGTAMMAQMAEPVRSSQPSTIVALDLSLTSTGWAKTDIVIDGAFGTLVPRKPFDRGMARLAWIRSQIIWLTRGADLVVIEGYAFGAKGAAVFSLGELGGAIRLALYDFGIPYVDVSPSSLKMFATGKGNAPKDDVFAAAIRKLDYAGTSHDEADALWLLEMARLQYRGGTSSFPQERALSKIAWPTFGGSQ